MSDSILITEETLTDELTALGYLVGDEMPVAPITGEEDFTITQEFIDAQPKDLVEIDKLVVGDVIKRPIFGAIPAKEVPPAPSVVEDTTDEDGTVHHVVTEQDHTDGKFADIAVGEVASFKPETSTDTQQADIVPAPAPEAPVVISSSEPYYKVYQGKKVISEGARELNDKNYIVIRLEDGSSYDLTQAQYDLEVVLKDN